MSHTPSVPFSPADFQVVEFRRYTIVPGGRETFVRYFEHFFPESFQQLGCLALGQGYEAGGPMASAGYAVSVRWKRAPSPAPASITGRCGRSTAPRSTP